MAALRQTYCKRRALQRSYAVPIAWVYDEIPRQSVDSFACIKILFCWGKQCQLPFCTGKCKRYTKLNRFCSFFLLLRTSDNVAQLRNLLRTLSIGPSPCEDFVPFEARIDRHFHWFQKHRPVYSDHSWGWGKYKSQTMSH